VGKFNTRYYYGFRPLLSFSKNVKVIFSWWYIHFFTFLHLLIYNCEQISDLAAFIFHIVITFPTVFFFCVWVSIFSVKKNLRSSYTKSTFRSLFSHFSPKEHALEIFCLSFFFPFFHAPAWVGLKPWSQARSPGSTRSPSACSNKVSGALSWS
jgi:hypothetical protein